MVGKRILVVDDEDPILQTTKLLLASGGNTVETATSASEALAKLEVDDFDLVLTDLAMPEMTGDRLAHEIKTRNPSLPVILLSGYPHETLPPNIDDALLKPFSADDLRNVIAKFA